MRSILSTTTAVLSLLITNTQCTSGSNRTDPLSSRIIFPISFTPPQVFQNVNLLRIINLEKAYARETINVVIENIDSQPQDQYFLPFPGDIIGKVGGLEVRDKKEPDNGLIDAELVEYDPSSSTQFYRIRLSKPLPKSAQLTLSITYAVLSILSPLPSSIAQQDRQYLVYSFSAYLPSAYPTLKQKTKVKFPTTDVPEYTTIPASTSGSSEESPQRQGSTYTYGPFTSLPASAQLPVSARYEFTKPLIHASLLERDIEVSHWGGNLAFEERYWLTNLGANLSTRFSRVQWATTNYYNPPTSALKEFRVPLKPGSMNPYFTDDIGNISTSRFRSNSREALLELKPRYPIFGGWFFNFRIGWDAPLASFLRKTSSTSYVLKVPFLEGPKQPEGIEYDKVVLRIILPEGAENVKHLAPISVLSTALGLHKTFMDTVGRTTLTIVAKNVVDDVRDRDLLVTYDYPFTAGMRKPVTIFVSVAALFVAAWGLGRVDIGIGKKPTVG